jgi:hypothetical protein
VRRWDAPLFLSLASVPVDLSSVAAAILERAPPPPNQSTQCQPLSSTNFLHEVDKVVPNGHVFCCIGRVTRDRCYDFKNIFAEKIGVFDSKQS